MFRRLPTLALIALVAGSLVSASGRAQATGPVGVATRAFPAQTPFYACFEAAMALRIGDEVTFDTPRSGEAAQVGKVRHWVEDHFRSGACLALPVGTEIARTTQAVVSGRHVQRFQIAGTSEWLVRPDWAMAPGPGGGLTDVQRAYLAMVPITVSLMDYAARHIECLIEVKALNERVIAHNMDVIDDREAGKDGITRTVIIMNPSDLDVRGERLNREVEDFKGRCTQYSVLEAATPFVRMARELGGLDPNLSQAAPA